MGLAKGLSVVSMLATLLAVVIIFTGQQDSAKSLIGTDDASRNETLSDSVLGKANLTKDSGQIEELLRATVLYSATEPVVTKKGLTAALESTRPDSGIGLPLDAGGTSVDVVKNKNGQQVAVLCVRPTVDYVCGAVDMDSRIQKTEVFNAPLGTQNIIFAKSIQ